MQKRRLFVLFVLLMAIAASSQQSAKLTVKAAVVTNDLSVKPVPKLALSIDPEVGPPTLLSTNFEGVATIDLPLGKYRVKTTRGIDFESKHFDWDVALEVKAGDNQL